jgi:hypothetical protein
VSTFPSYFIRFLDLNYYILFVVVNFFAAFAYDPDGYAIEIIKRGGLDFGDVKTQTK